MFIEIPPTGSFGVGKSIHHIVDTTRSEKYAQSDNRELILYIYYPTQEKSTSSYAQDIMPILKEKLHKSLNVKGTDLNYLNSLKEHTILNASLSNVVEKFPILFFSPGLEDPVETYTTLLEEMASYGYVVIAINPTYAVDPTVFPDGKTIRMNSELANFWYATHRSFEDIVDEEHEYWLQDANFVINSIKNISPNDSYSFLRNRLDYDLMGAFGHSFGGSLVLQLCRDRKDIKACVNLDGIAFGPKNKRLEVFNKPSMIIAADKEVTDEELEKHNISRSQYDQLVVPRHPRLMYNALNSDSYFVTIKNSDHNSFSDLNILKYPMTKNGDPIGIINKTRVILLHFFNHYLKNNKFNSEIIRSLPGVIFESK
ncbi:MAG: hypothetical protein Q8Q25_01770 [bacterium]|nr:hypothetical protein [bacterium]